MRPRVNAIWISRTVAAVMTIIIPIAAAGDWSPASSMLRTATDAKVVSDEYRNTTAETVVIAFTNRYIDTSRIAGVHTGTVTRQNVL